VPLRLAPSPAGAPHFYGSLDQPRFSERLLYTSGFEVPQLLHMEPSTPALFHLDNRTPADRCNTVPGGFRPLVMNGTSSIDAGAQTTSP
jgi:hypothetical protein